MKNPVLLIVLGLVLLAAGAVLSLTGGPPKADAAIAAQCRERMRDQPDMAAKCDEAAFATAMTATDADSAARAISAANNSEIGGNTLAMFLLGLGVVLTGAGVFARWKRGNAAT
ncbi:MAG: hypothetical protein V4564_20715 [Pseudomonadota bacterium]|uniref:hypothetical protein n=1 Tax=Sphingomonas sp. ERG5 TaxID=1381597 RepID=UPI00054B1379|nr:hypothetical protein [Sphingomonas sp. ERG5]